MADRYTMVVNTTRFVAKSDSHMCSPGIMSPNKHMQRAGRHKVLGRERLSLVPCSAPRARVLTGRRAGADVNRWAT